MKKMNRKIATMVFLVMAVTPAMGQVGIFDQEADWGPRGNEKVAGSASFSDGVYSLEGNGDDIWNNDDEGFFLYTEQSGSWSLSGEFTWVSPGTNEWAKLGPMIRAEGDAAGSINYYAGWRGAQDLVSPQWRDATDGASGSFGPRIQNTNGQQLIPPDSTVWLRVTRVAEADDLLIMEWSLDGNDWYYGHDYQLELPESVAYGIAITNHEDNQVLATATAANVELNQFNGTVLSRAFDNDIATEGGTIGVTLSVVANPGAVTLTETLPEGWSATDISDGGTADGNVITWELTDAITEVSYTAEIAVGTESNYIVGNAGGVSVIGEHTFTLLRQGLGVFDFRADIGDVGAAGEIEELGEGSIILRGSGADVWGTGDEFHYSFNEIRGAFTIRGLVQTFAVDGNATNSKGGFMVRENLTAGSPNMFFFARSDNQLIWQRRATQGGSTIDGDLVPAGDHQEGEIELHRVGDVFNLYYVNSSGSRVLYDSVSVPMSETVYIGAAITATSDGTFSEVWAEDIEITQHPFMVSRSVNQTIVNPGDTIEVNITLVVNEGETSNVSFEEVIPAGFTVVSSESSSGEVADENGTLTWSLSGAEGEQTLTYSIMASDGADVVSELSGTFDDGAGYSGVSGSDTIFLVTVGVGEELFSFDFSDPAQGDEWEALAGTWEVIDGEFRETADAGGPLVAVTGDVLTDVAINVDAMGLVADADWGIVFRATDIQNFYSWQFVNGALELLSYVGNTRTTLYNEPFAEALNEWQNYQIIVKDDLIHLYFNGELRTIIQDGALTEGQVGLFAWVNSGTDVDTPNGGISTDNFVVSAVGEPTDVKSWSLY